MFKSRFFLDGREPVHEDVITTSRLTLAQDLTRRVLEERSYEIAEILRDGRVVARLAGGGRLGAVI